MCSTKALTICLYFNDVQVWSAHGTLSYNLINMRVAAWQLHYLSTLATLSTDFYAAALKCRNSQHFGVLTVMSFEITTKRSNIKMYVIYYVPLASLS